MVTATKMDYPRKRPACSGPSTAPKVINKSRPSVDYQALSNEGQTIVTQAAAIIQGSEEDAPAAISRLRRRKPRRQAKRKMGGQSGILKPQSSPRPSESSKGYWEKLLQDADLHGDDMNTDSSFCTIDKYFGFEKLPSRWANCFSSLAPTEPSFAYETEYNGGCFPNSMSCCDAAPPFGGMPQSAQSFSNHNQFLNYPVDTHHDPFACDAPFLGPQFLSGYPVLQPTQVQTMQPSTSREEMIYSRNESDPDLTIWHQNVEFKMVNIQDYDTSQRQVAEAGMYYERPESGLEEDLDNVTSLEMPGFARRGPFHNFYDREETAQTRKHAACIRCRCQRIRCNPDHSNPQGVCMTCKKSNMKLSKLPCLRYKITDVRLFKPGQVPGMEWTGRWSDSKSVGSRDNISTWASAEKRIIQITEGYSSSPLTLEVREFVPLEGDMLRRSWVAEGVKKSAYIPPYAIFDLAAAEQAYKDYIKRLGGDLIMRALDPKDRLLRGTYNEAVETAKSPETSDQEKMLLRGVLELWVAIRITSRSIRICGNETLGMSSDVLDETSPLHGKIPIPPVMGAQIELILIQSILGPLRGQIMGLLQKLILANKPKAWFTIYLCTFILLHNCAMITKHDAGYARKHGIKTQFARPDNVAEYHMGANILLAHFHYCNKGFLPFAIDVDVSELATIAHLSPKQIRFVEATRRYVKSNEARFEELLGQKAFENDYYFIAQLYEKDWTPRTTV